MTGSTAEPTVSLRAAAPPAATAGAAPARHTAPAPAAADTAATATDCAWCAGPLPWIGAVRHDDGRAWCCRGCAEATRFTEAEGLGDYFARRDHSAPRPGGTTPAAFLQRVQPDVTPERDGTCSLDFRLGGLRCSACVWLNEKVLERTPGVLDARVSYATGRAHVRWRPDAVSLETITRQILSLGYEPHALEDAGHEDRDLLSRAGVAWFCAGNVMLLQGSVYLGLFSGDMAPHYARLFEWASLVLATPATFWAAEPFFDRAWRGLRAQVLSMDLPIALAIAVMYAHGAWALFAGQLGYLDSLTMLIALLLTGRYAEQRGRMTAGAAAEGVLSEAPATAWRRASSGDVEEVPLADVVVGDTLVLGAGSRAGVDGLILAGEASVDLSHVTGESRPEGVSAGDSLPAGATVVDGRIDLQVTATGRDATLGQIAQLVERALSARGRAQQLSDRLAPGFTAAVLVAGFATALGWGLTAGWARAIPVTVAVLVVACPCALSLAGPSVIAASVGAAARRGAFVRGGDVVERLAEVDELLLDKTGTLTRGRPQVTDAANEPLAIAAALEAGSRHPIARGILEEAHRRALPLPQASAVRELAGVGMSGRVGADEARVVSDGPGRVRVELGDRIVGAISLEDALRPEAAATLRTTGLPFSILSGDDPDIVDRTGALLAGAGATPAQLMGGLRPDEKLQVVEAHRAAGRRPVFVGDGLNDAAALAAAHVGVAMGGGAAASARAAGVVILSDSLAPLLGAIQVAHVARTVLRVTAITAITYNVLAVAAAMAGFVTPLFAAILMPLSSASVILQAMSIDRRARRRAERTHAEVPSP